MVLILAVPLGAFAAANPASGGSDFEIPLSELSKERKMAPPKKSGDTQKKSKKSDAGIQKKKDSPPPQVASKGKKRKLKKDTVQAAGAVTPPPSSKQTEFIPPHHHESGADAPKAAPHVVDHPALASGSIRIDHEPYSFVVTGKSIVLNAVVYQHETRLKTVTCKFRLAKSGAYSVVTMTKVAGARFTYEATLPRPEVNSTALLYSFIAIDSSGGESATTEFVTPVTSSPTTPDWQF